MDRLLRHELGFYEHCSLDDAASNNVTLFTFATVMVYVIKAAGMA